MNARVRIGVDLGGTKIELVALDHRGDVAFRARCATPRDDYRQILAAIARLVDQAEDALGAGCSVGIGTPGAPSATDGWMKNSNTTCLNGQPLLGDLERTLKRPVRLANDANCFALSEATDGAAAGASVVFGVILGTGCGGGLVVDGRLLTGANAIAGEWGHNPLPWPEPDELPGPACYCGRRGCIETFLSGPGLALEYRQESGSALDAAAVSARALAGDPLANEVVARYCHRLARSLATVINLVDPDVIVLGGGVSQLPLLYQRVPELWRAFVFSDVVDTVLRAAKHGASSGVRGAAWLWPANAGPV